MSVGDVLTVIGAVVATSLLGWYFFGPKKTHRADVEGGVQVAASGEVGAAASEPVGRARRPGCPRP